MEGQSVKKQWPRGFALEVVRDMLPWLEPHCHRLLVAGSLRRMKETVGDIEILFIPRMREGRDPNDLFSAATQVSAVDEELMSRLAAGDLSRRQKVTGAVSAWGMEMKHAIHECSGMPVDFFGAKPETWACNLVCRTGSAAFNTRLAMLAREKGWMWHPTGEGFERLSGPERGRVKVMKSEREIFKFLELEFLEPEERR